MWKKAEKKHKNGKKVVDIKKVVLYNNLL